MDNPLLSIIIPVYNAEKTLEKCVQSVSLQTYSPIEVILVDDGSKDGSPELCDDLAKSDTRILVIHQSNNGPNSARNRGIENANGSFLVFVDSDDEFYTPETLEQNMRFFLESQEIDIVSFPQYRESDNMENGSRLLQSKEAQFSARLLTDKREMFINWFNGRLIDGGFPGKIFRKSLFDGWRLIESIRFTEDHYNIPDLVERCRTIQISGVGGYVYKYNASSAIHTEYTADKRRGQLLSELRLYEYLLNFTGVTIYKSQFYFLALENAYYLISTSHEDDVMKEMGVLKRWVIYAAPSGFLQLLSTMTILFGFRYGLKLTYRAVNFIKNENSICRLLGWLQS